MVTVTSSDTHVRDYQVGYGSDTVGKLENCMWIDLTDSGILEYLALIGVSSYSAICGVINILYRIENL